MDGWKSPSSKVQTTVSKEQLKEDLDDTLDYLFDVFVDYYPDDSAYLTDAIEKSYPASTNSQKHTNQHNYSNSNNCDKGTAEDQTRFHCEFLLIAKFHFVQIRRKLRKRN